MALTLTAQDYTTVEDGEYPAKFAGYEEKDTQFGKTVILQFELLDEENRGVPLSGMASQKLTPKAKLRGWIEGMLGRPLETGENVNLDALIGSKVMLYVTTEDTDKGMFNRIEKIRKPKSKAAAKPAPKPVVEDEDEEESDIPF
jgi:hypothetical protein